VPGAPVAVGRCLGRCRGSASSAVNGGTDQRAWSSGSSGSAKWCCDLGARISCNLEIGVNGEETGFAASGGAACG
jgi:hypothetical protein